MFSYAASEGEEGGEGFWWLGFAAARSRDGS